MKSILNKDKRGYMDLEQRKKVQLQIMDAFDSFCTKHNLRYSLACGTLLGAVRHKGFIPWDDDIDLYMPREDYKRLESLFPMLLDNKYKLASVERNNRWHIPYAKLYDDTTILEETKYHTEKIGVNIDVFIADDVPVEKREWEDCYKHYLAFNRVLAIKNLKWSAERNIIKNVGIYCLKLLYFYKDKQSIVKEFDAFCQQYNEKGYDHWFELTGVGMKFPEKKSLFAELVQYPFEGRLFWGFKDADEYLTHYYGDYMKLPPEEERITHHHSIAYSK